MKANTDTIRTLTTLGKLKEFIHEHVSVQKDIIPDNDIRKVLRTYNTEVIDAAVYYNNTKELKYLTPFVIGLIIKQADPEYHNKLIKCDDSLTLFTELYMDSLMLTEIIIAVEESFKVKII